MSCLVDRSQYEEPLRRYHDARLEGRTDVADLEAEALAANLGIAVAFARRSKGHASLEDVEAAAQIGLLEAMRTWDKDGGANLSTWARGPMAAKIREVKGQTVGAVRIPTKTLRAVREIAESGEDVDAACARMGKRASVVKAAMSVRSCEWTPEIGAASSMDDRVFAAEMDDALTGAAKCWRDEIDVLALAAAAESLAQRHAEHLAAAKTADPRTAAEHRALAEALWPASADGRLRVLSRLDYALGWAAEERELDVTCWRRHYVDGEQWTKIGEHCGVTRTRVQFRARRAERSIVDALLRATEWPDEAIEIWARRPAEVVALERLGVLTDSNPLEILYAVEDLEVALTEIDPRHAKAWADRSAGEPVPGKRKAARDMARRADAALRELLGTVGDAVQLELLSPGVGGDWLSISWLSPLAVACPVRVVRVTRLRGGHRRGASPPARALTKASRGRPHDDSLGCPASPGWVGCTGPPDGARAPPESFTVAALAA